MEALHGVVIRILPRGQAKVTLQDVVAISLSLSLSLSLMTAERGNKAKLKH